MPRPTIFPYLLFLAATLFSSNVIRADDWPQWMGPRRDDVWREKGLLEAFPKTGANVLWRVPVGGGYAGPAVAGGRVFVTDYVPSPTVARPANPFQRITQPGSEHVLCFDQASGKLLWKHEEAVAYSMSYSIGPRATPAIDGDQIYVLGGEGDLLCLDVSSGNLIWSRKSADEKRTTPTWGFASHPLIDGPRLICLTGGSDPEHGYGVVTAFDKLTGKTIWSALAAKEPGYAPPMIYQSGSVRQLIVWDPESVNGLDPETGKVYWTVPYGPAMYGVTILTPRPYHDAIVGDVLFLSTQYEGATLLKLDDQEPRASILWKRHGKNDRHTEALQVLLSTPSIRDGHIYGVDILGELRCLDLKTGDRIWETNDATNYNADPQKWMSAFLIKLGDSGAGYLIANEHGDLILADLDPAGYREKSRTHLLDPTNMDAGRPVLWCHPAFAGRCIFWRNDKEMICASMAAAVGTN